MTMVVVTDMSENEWGRWAMRRDHASWRKAGNTAVQIRRNAAS